MMMMKMMMMMMMTMMATMATMMAKITRRCALGLACSLGACFSVHASTARSLGAACFLDAARPLDAPGSPRSHDARPGRRALSAHTGIETGECVYDERSSAEVQKATRIEAERAPAESDHLSGKATRLYDRCPSAEVQKPTRVAEVGTLSHVRSMLQGRNRSCS